MVFVLLIVLPGVWIHVVCVPTVGITKNALGCRLNGQATRIDRRSAVKRANPIVAAGHSAVSRGVLSRPV